ncbi:MAG: DegT/DnrJ/EryC1/StrS family aminotransferase [Candidatus Bathyarchaeia archaeon]
MCGELRRIIPIAHPLIGREEIDAVTSVLKSGILTSKHGDGPYVKRFEETFAKYIGVKYALTMSSGTAALHASLMAAEVQSGDEVIVPSFAFAAVSEAVVLAGAKPVFVDIDPQTFCMDPSSFESAITSKTRAVIPVHLFGLMADMEKICEIARKHDIIIIEDCAQAHGAAYNGRKAGSIGDFGCFSFYASKNMTTGEGGMVTVNRREYAEALASIRNHGEGKLYNSERVGHNYRMSEVAAAIGYNQLLKLPRFNDARRRNANKLTSLLEASGKLILPQEPQGYSHSWYVYTVRLRGSRAGERDKVVDKLVNSGIQAAVYYRTPLHLSPLYRRRYGYRRGALPKTETAARQVFSLPVHPGLTDEDLEFIAQRLSKVID